ncbi:MAG TPA: hypothetical protein VFH48_15415 [Chloroflexota bacterium]|nr:hypothetical protein [Chloroflexota bacterium]
MHAPALTADERAVLRLSAMGLGSREVAASLGWPLDRVRSATMSAIVTLGATSKLEAVIIAYCRGEL